jgi:putative transposase
MSHIKSYKIRLYPTKAQEELMWKHVGASRWLWNYMLEMQGKNYEQGGKYISRFNMIKLLTPLKKQQEALWLNEVSKTTLEVVCTDLNLAFQEFFKKRRGYPKFKSRKRSKPNFPIRSERLYFTENETVNVEKIGKIRYKTDFVFPKGRGKAKFSNARISNRNGKWLLSFGMEVENQDFTLTDSVVGIDLGIKDLAVVAVDDEIIVHHNINKSRRVRTLKKKLKRTQRAISRKYEASRKRNGGKYVKTNNIVKLEAKARSLHARITNIRQNYLHQVTHSIVKELPSRVVMEDLNVTGMMKNRHLSKAIAEQCLYEFVRQMQYKCEWRGIELVKADRFYPSSKTCSGCGHIKQDLKLSDRTYVCEQCGLVIGRDANAAINLQKYCA